MSPELTVKAAFIDISTDQSVLCICTELLVTANHTAEGAGLQSLSVQVVSNC